MANTTCKEIKYEGAPVLAECAKRDGDGKVIASTYSIKGHNHTTLLRFYNKNASAEILGGEEIQLVFAGSFEDATLEAIIYPNEVRDETLTITVPRGSNVTFDMSSYDQVYIKQIGPILFCIGNMQGTVSTSCLFMRDGDDHITLALSGASSSSCYVTYQFIGNGYF